jgi:hypothetical protein
MMQILWLSMMLLWLGGLLFGLWWIWPHVERGAITGDLVVSILWLTTGTLAWLLALNMGRQRYWRR